MVRKSLSWWGDFSEGAAQMVTVQNLTSSRRYALDDRR